MSTVVVYNNVVLRNVVTRQWDQEVVYDASHTDQIVSRFHLRFDGILHLQNASAAPAAIQTPYSTGMAGSQGMGLTYESARSLLSQPRAQLQVYTVDAAGNQTTILQSLGLTSSTGAANSPYVDTENGPKPTHISITQIVGTQLFKVSFAIDCALYNGPMSNPTHSTVPGVIDNRWSQTESFDDRMFCTRTIHGTIRVGSYTVTPDMVGTLIVPLLETGFKREHFQFVTTPDGLQVEYEVTDRQVHTSAPWPATKIEAVHSESTNDGLTILSSMRVRLDGHPGAPKLALLALACSICETYLGPISQITQGKFIESASFVDYIGEQNAVEVSLALKTVLPSDPSQNAALCNVGFQTFGAPLSIKDVVGNYTNYNPTVSQAPPYTGWVTQAGDTHRPAAWLALACYLQTPFIDVHGIGVESPYWVNPGAVSNQPPSSSQPTQVSGSTGSITPETGSSNYQSPQTQESPYTHARVALTYHIKNSRVTLPIAANPNQNQAGGENNGGGNQPAGNQNNNQAGGNNNNTVVVATVGLPMGVLEVDYDAERAGAQPEIPAPLDQFSCSNGTLIGTLLKAWIRPQPASVDAAKRVPIYRTGVHYFYALNRPPNDQDNLPLGQLPFVKVDNQVIYDNVTINQQTSDRLTIGTATDNSGNTQPAGSGG